MSVNEEFTKFFRPDIDELFKQEFTTEDAPTNSAGGGQIAGIGVGPAGEPPNRRKKKLIIVPPTK